MPINPIALTRQLVDIESITYNEGKAGAFLYEYLLGLGYSVEKMMVEQPDPSIAPGAGKEERFNLYASLPGVTPDVVFSTHFDTVPPYFPSSEDDEFIHGRGSCDAKGILAAQIAAAEKLIAGGVKTGLLFVVGEERDSAGAKVANKNPRGSKFLINGEPTESKVALGSKGILRYEIIATGKMAHSAYPELGESAIEKLLDALDAIRRMPLPEDPILGRTTINIGTISGGRAPNIIPDAAKAELAVRLVGDGRKMDRTLRSAVGARAEVREILELPPMHFKSLDGFPTSVVSFTTDIPVLAPAWGEPFLFGPGSIHVAHTTEEKISKRELLGAVDTYVQMTRMLLSRAEAHHA